jgi:hypothetical protein
LPKNAKDDKQKTFKKIGCSINDKTVRFNLTLVETILNKDNKI